MPFKIEVDYVKGRMIIRSELTLPIEALSGRVGTKPHYGAYSVIPNIWNKRWHGRIQLSTGFGGSQSFAAWSTKAQVLQKLGKDKEAAAVMTKALPYGTMNDIHQYGRQLIALKMPKDAFEVFKKNYQNNPDQFTALVGTWFVVIPPRRL